MMRKHSLIVSTSKFINKMRTALGGMFMFMESWSRSPSCHYLILHCSKMDRGAAQDIFCKKQLWSPKLQNDIHS